jgi:antitoxin ParD1/3/4
MIDETTPAAATSASMAQFARECQIPSKPLASDGMAMMNVSLPDELKEFVDQQVSHGSYGTTGEYIRELLRRERDRVKLRGWVLEGANSPTKPVDKHYFKRLRSRMRKAAKSSKRQ